jgi:hypothetical protein
MYLYLELWKPRDAWRALPADERQQLVERIGPAIAGLLESGIELVGFARNDGDTTHRADYAYLAAWRMPSQEHALALENAVTDSGFHDYFEQINARGEIAAPDAILAHMVRSMGARR